MAERNAEEAPVAGDASAPELYFVIEATFRALLEVAPDGVVLGDARGRLPLVNRQIELMPSYRRDELIRRPFEALVPVRFHGMHVHHREGYMDAPRIRPMVKWVIRPGLVSRGDPHLLGIVVEKRARRAAVPRSPSRSTEALPTCKERRWVPERPSMRRPRATAEDAACLISTAPRI